MTVELFKQHFRLEGEQLIRVSTGEPIRHGPTKGYQQTSLEVEGKRRVFRIHRIKFGLKHGYLPDIVDHKDRTQTNASLDNLRPATKALNGVNVARSPAGVRQVGKRFKAYITIDRKQKHLGSFGTREEAQMVADTARAQRYGEFFHGRQGVA